MTDLAAELSQPLPLLGVYSSARPKHNFWALASLQIGLCITTSLFLSYYFYNRLHFGGKKSWTTAINISTPIRKRLQNLEKERAIWKYYLQWMEDYFFVYCDLLRFLNKTTLDVEKIYRDHILGLNQVASSELVSESTTNASKISENHSILSLETNPSEEDLQIIASFARVLGLKAFEDIEKKNRSDSVKPTSDPANLGNSGDETNEVFLKKESKSIPGAPDGDVNVRERSRF